MTEPTDLFGHPVGSSQMSFFGEGESRLQAPPQTVFPNMAKWLPEEEANQLRFEFAREMERLKAAA